MTATIHILREQEQIDPQILQIFERRLAEKSIISFSQPADITINLRLDQDLSPEGFCIFADGEYTICGGSTIGLLHGIGQFIRGCRPGEPFDYNGWTGKSIPEMPYRLFYLPLHFHNYYHMAPLSEVCRYLEDMALMGYNAILMWYDMHHYHAIDEPVSLEMIDRMISLYQKAQSLGMMNFMSALSNEAFADSPEHLRARSSGGHDDYTGNLMGHYHVELCPSKPGAIELMLKWRRDVLQRFSSCNINGFMIWPYDQGGCTCSQCKPWGVNGNIRMAEPIADLVKSFFPEANLIFSTWRFDSFTRGEWISLHDLLQQKQKYADLLLVEMQEPGARRHIIQHGVPGNLPMIGFPEISMIGAVPWGGFGTNPHPQVIQQNWQVARHYVQGGAPYSEGIYEDINKFICAQMYWKPDQSCLDSAREYVLAEFTADQGLVDEIMQLIQIFEETLERHRIDEQGTIHDYPDDLIPRVGIERFVVTRPEKIKTGYELMCRIDQRLPHRIRTSWRWRLFYLRASIDSALVNNDYLCNEETDRYMEELTRLYYAAEADYACAPPTRHVIATKSTGTTFITFDKEVEQQYDDRT